MAQEPSITAKADGAIPARKDLGSGAVLTMTEVMKSQEHDR
jgi:hypothetical protein